MLAKLAVFEIISLAGTPFFAVLRQRFIQTFNPDMTGCLPASEYCPSRQHFSDTAYMSMAEVSKSTTKSAILKKPSTNLPKNVHVSI